MSRNTLGRSRGRAARREGTTHVALLCRPARSTIWTWQMQADSESMLLALSKRTTAPQSRTPKKTVTIAVEGPGRGHRAGLLESHLNSSEPAEPFRSVAIATGMKKARSALSSERLCCCRSHMRPHSRRERNDITRSTRPESRISVVGPKFVHQLCFVEFVLCRHK
jgi:hypothetical protein